MKALWNFGQRDFSGWSIGSVFNERFMELSLVEENGVLFCKIVKKMITFWQTPINENHVL